MCVFASLTGISYGQVRQGCGCSQVREQRVAMGRVIYEVVTSPEGRRAAVDAADIGLRAYERMREVQAQREAARARDSYMDRMAARTPREWQSRSRVEVFPDYGARARDAYDRYSTADARVKELGQRYIEATRRSAEAGQRYVETMSSRARRDWIAAGEARDRIWADRERAREARDTAARETRESKDKAKDIQDWRDRQREIFDSRP